MKRPGTELIARRVAREIHPGTLVNLGIGLPTQVAAFLPPGITVFFQTENGLAGVGPRPMPGTENPNLVDAGGGFITAIPGAASFDSTFSFGLIRGGHLDLTVLGGLQVDAKGRLANWMIPGVLVPGMGGAMDLVSGARRVIVAMNHTARGLGQDRRGMHPPAHLDSTRGPGGHRPGGHRADARRARACGSGPRASRSRRSSTPPPPGF